MYYDNNYSFGKRSVNESIRCSRYICDNCHKRRNTKKRQNPFASKNLPTTRLGTYIETRVNNFLRKKEADAGEVYIRVVYSGDKTVEVKGGMKRRCVHDLRDVIHRANATTIT